jgi:hypothetical protein
MSSHRTDETLMTLVLQAGRRLAAESGVTGDALGWAWGRMCQVMSE